MIDRLQIDKVRLILSRKCLILRKVDPVSSPPDFTELADQEIGDVDHGATTDNVGGKRVALVGRLGGMNRREATNVLRSFDAVVVDRDADAIDWVVIGAEESPLAEAELLSERTRADAATGQLEILHETELWQRLGLVEVEQSIRRYYTPAMLADLLGVSAAVVRRWHRRGLITPVRTLHKLPYFDFQEVATARRLAQWIASGASPQAIESRLVELVEVLPDIQRPLDQLSILIEGKQVLLRQGEGLLEPGGQLRFDFDAMESAHRPPTVNDSVVSMTGRTYVQDLQGTGRTYVQDLLETGRTNLQDLQGTGRQPHAFPLESEPSAEEDQLLSAVFESEEANQLATSVDYCHAILARDGPRADVCFLLGELLYRDGQVIAARERYYMAIELDPEFVEARTSLAGILAETGQNELAVAAYRGALELHEDYPDAHYHLARLLDQLGRDVEARHHWQRFLELAPESPWATEATERLQDV